MRAESPHALFRWQPDLGAGREANAVECICSGVTTAAVRCRRRASIAEEECQQVYPVSHVGSTVVIGIVITLYITIHYSESDLVYRIAKIVVFLVFEFQAKGTETSRAFAAEETEGSNGDAYG